jgi:hypothetical protein
VGGGGAKLYDVEKAWSSINHSILSPDNNFGFDTVIFVVSDNQVQFSIVFCPVIFDASYNLSMIRSTEELIRSAPFTGCPIASNSKDAS